MKMLMSIIKKVVLSICMLYSFNLIVSGAGYYVPINIASITVVSFLGIPSIVALLALKMIIK